MLGQKHRQGGWTKGVVTLFAALAVAWAMLAAPSLAAQSTIVSASRHACCPQAAGNDGGTQSDPVKIEHRCDADMGCPSPDCTVMTGCVAAGISERPHLTSPGLGLEARSRAISSRPHSFALPIPKQPPKL